MSKVKNNTRKKTFANHLEVLITGKTDLRLHRMEKEDKQTTNTNSSPTCFSKANLTHKRTRKRYYPE